MDQDVSLWEDLLNTGLLEDVSCYYVYLIFWMCRSMWDLCDRFMLGFEEAWIIEKLIGFLFWLNGVYYKNLFSLAYPCFSYCVINCDNCTMYMSKWSYRCRRFWRALKWFFEPYIVNVCISISHNPVIRMFWNNS